MKPWRLRSGSIVYELSSGAGGCEKRPSIPCGKRLIIPCGKGWCLSLKGLLILPEPSDWHHCSFPPVSKVAFLILERLTERVG